MLISSLDSSNLDFDAPFICNGSWQRLTNHMTSMSATVEMQVLKDEEFGLTSVIFTPYFLTQ